MKAERLNKIINNFLMIGERVEPSVLACLQSIDEAISMLSPKTLRDQRRLEVAKENTRNLRLHLRRMEGKINELQEKVKLLETTINENK